ncbi:hypothetical protein ACFLS1_05805 [Verrucomicrobiota bacterium]
MKERTLSRLIWGGSIIILAAGTALSIHSAWNINTVSKKLERKSSDLKKLYVIQAEANGFMAAVEKFEQLPDKRLITLEEFLKKTLPAGSAYDIRETLRKEIRGWTVYRKELSFGQTQAEVLMRLVGEAEALRPPWRLVKCEIKSTPSPGSVKAVLTMEGLEKR